MKFCIDCEYCTADDSAIPNQNVTIFYCTRPNLVTGKLGRPNWIQCKVERGEAVLCGPEGRFFAEKSASSSSKGTVVAVVGKKK